MGLEFYTHYVYGILRNSPKDNFHSSKFPPWRRLEKLTENENYKCQVQSANDDNQFQAALDKIY